MFSRKRLVPTFVAMLALALLLAACGGGGNGEEPATESQPSASEGPREIRVLLQDFAFEPEDITVKSGERVKLVLVNEGSVPHDWNVDSMDLVSPVVAAGQTATFEFTAGEAGTYEAYCAEPGHEALGMVGTIIIE